MSGILDWMEWRELMALIELMMRHCIEWIELKTMELMMMVTVMLMIIMAGTPCKIMTIMELGVMVQTV